MGRIWQAKIAGLPSDDGAPTWPKFVSEPRYAEAAARRTRTLVAEVEAGVQPAESSNVFEGVSEDDDGQLDLQPEHHVDPVQSASLDSYDLEFEGSELSDSTIGDERDLSEPEPEPEAMDVDYEY